MNTSSIDTGVTRKDIIIGFRERMHIKNTRSGSVADFMTSSFGTVLFLTVNAAFFAIWIVLNTNIIPGYVAFDPYPFGFLTMVVSLEAIFLSIIVLISQNRANEVADLREEVEFEISIRAENEITRILNMLDEIHVHLGLTNTNEKELETMKQPINIEELGAEFLEAKNRRK